MKIIFRALYATSALLLSLNVAADSAPPEFNKWFFSHITPYDKTQEPSFFGGENHIITDNLEALKTAFPNYSTMHYPLSSLGFGVLVNNENFHIYRSKALGESGFYRLRSHLFEHHLPLPKLVVYTNKDGYRKKTIVHQMQRFSHAFNNFSDFAYQEAIVFSEQGIEYRHPLNASVFLAGHNLLHTQDRVSWREALSEVSRFYFVDLLSRLKHRPFESKQENIYNVLELILQNKDVLFHCTGGIHRTGMVSMAIRYLQGGPWTWPFPYPVVVFSGKGLREELHNHAELEYFLHNRDRFRRDNLNAIRELAEQERFKNLVVTYRDLLNAPEDFNSTPLRESLSSDSSVGDSGQKSATIMP